MSNRPLSLEKLVFRVRRRMIWKSRLERIARCMVAACAAAVFTALAAAWMGSASLPATGFILLSGAFIGAIWAATVKSDPLISAKWIDQRLDLKDLLATAWSVRASRRAWESSILASAERACGQVNPERLKQPLGNGQTWSAIALGAALALTLGMISPLVRPFTLPANIAAAIAPDAQSNLPQFGSHAVAPRGRPAGDAALNEQSNRQGGGSQPGDDVKNSPPDSGSDNGAKSNQSGSNQSGVAAGVSRTAMRIPPLSTPGGNAKTADGSTQGAIAGGGAGTSTGTDRSVLAESSTGSSAPIAPPWKSGSWPQAQAAAMQSLKAGLVDPAYQSIVRDYFQHP